MPDNTLQPCAASAQPIADSASLPAPWSYAYQYHDCIRFSDGREINGSKPTKAIGLYREEDVRALIAAERERCALLCENTTPVTDEPAWHGQNLAAAIRAGDA